MRWASFRTLRGCDTGDSPGNPPRTIDRVTAPQSAEGGPSHSRSGGRRTRVLLPRTTGAASPEGVGRGIIELELHRLSTIYFVRQRSTAMSTQVRVFDPAMCCSTGVCGPSVAPDLARFSADL